jgi:hypothetical protein
MEALVVDVTDKSPGCAEAGRSRSGDGEEEEQEEADLDVRVPSVGGAPK